MTIAAIGSVANLLNCARGLLGVQESPGGSNYAPPITTWYGIGNVPWCGEFVSFCMAHGGNPGVKYASCIDGATRFRSGQLGIWLGPNDAVKAGDCVFYHFSSGHAGENHTGLVEADAAAGAVLVTIEGNIGDRVQRVTRTRSTVVGFGRPPYAGTSSDSGGRPELRLGSTGFIVGVLQILLNALVTPPPSLTVDGVFGSSTQTAVETFQTEVSIPVTGVVDALTWHIFDNLMAWFSGLPPGPDPGTGGTPPTAPPVSIPTWPGVDYKIGDSGANIITIQNRLVVLGATSLTVDGNFTTDTDGVVRYFQASRQLPANGIVDQRTWNALWV